MSSIFNKFKDLKKGVECALYLLSVINRTARFCDFIEGFTLVLEAALICYYAILYMALDHCIIYIKQGFLIDIVFEPRQGPATACYFRTYTACLFFPRQLIIYVDA